MPEFRPIHAFVTSLRLTFGNVGTAVRLTWPWFAVSGLFQLVAEVFLPGWHVDDLPPADMVEPLVLRAPPYGPMLLAFAAVWVVTTIAQSSAWIVWQRFLFAGDMPRGLDRMPLDARVMRLLGNGLLLGLAFVALNVIPFVALWYLPWIIPEFGTRAGKLGVTAAVGLLAGGYAVAAVVVLTRLSLKLAAVSLGQDGYRFRDGWRDTAGHTLSITIVVCVAMLAMWLAGLAVSTAITASAPPIDRRLLVFAVLLSHGLSWLGLLFAATVNAILYQVFAGRRAI